MPTGARVPVGNTAQGGCRPGAVALHRYLIDRWGAGVGSFGCYNPTSRAGSGWSLHREGRAIDVSIAPSVKWKGDQIFGWCIANADHLGLQEIQWSGRIWTSRRNREGVRADTSAARNLHFDHLHIGLAYGWTFTPPGGGGIPGGGSGTPAPSPQQEEDDLTPEQAQQLDAVFNAIKNNAYGTAIQNNVMDTNAKVNKLHDAVYNNAYGTGLQGLVVKIAQKLGVLPGG